MGRGVKVKEAIPRFFWACIGGRFTKKVAVDKPRV